jgi:hypothetical protein
MLGSDIPGFTKVFKVSLYNNSINSITIDFNSILLEPLDGGGSAPGSFTLLTADESGNNASNCEGTIKSNNYCYLYIKYKTPPMPSHLWDLALISAKFTTVFSDGTTNLNTVSVKIKAKPSVFGDGEDGDLSLTGGTINPLLLTRKYDSTKKLFAYDEIKTVAPTTGTLDDPQSRIKIYRANQFSEGDEVMVYITSAGYHSLCAKNDLIGSHHFAKIHELDSASNTLDISPPLESTWIPITETLTAPLMASSDTYPSLFCNIQIIRVPHFSSLTLEYTILLVPQFLNSYLWQVNYRIEEKILGNDINRTGGVLPFRVNNTLTLKNSKIDGAGSGFNGGRKYFYTTDYDDSELGLGAGIYGWAAVYALFKPETIFWDTLFPNFSTGGDADDLASSGSNIGRGGYVSFTNPTDYYYYGVQSSSIASLKGITNLESFSIDTTKKFYLGSGGGYAATESFNNSDGQGQGLNGGGAVVIFANGIDSTNSIIDANGDTNTMLDIQDTKVSANLNISSLTKSVDGVTSSFPSDAITYILGTGTLSYKLAYDDTPTSLQITSGLIVSDGTTASLSITIDSGTYYLDSELKLIDSINVRDTGSNVDILVSTATMSISHETQKAFHHRGSGSGGSVWLTTRKFTNADLYIKAEGGGADVNRSRNYDNLDKQVETGGGGGNIQISFCGKSSFGFPKTSAVGGRTDYTKENLDPRFPIYAGNYSTTITEETKWGEGGLVSFKHGHEECRSVEERSLSSKEIPIYAVTYKDITSTGSLEQVTIRPTDLSGNPTQFFPSIGCFKGKPVNAYLEFRITDTEMDGGTLISSELVIPAIGQTRWNDKYISDHNQDYRMDRSQVGDAIRIRPSRTLQSQYLDNTTNLRITNLIDSASTTIDPPSPFFSSEYISWVNNSFFDTELFANFNRLLWPRNAPIKEPNMLQLIEQIEPYSNILSTTQMGASLGFLLERPGYFVESTAYTRYLSCEVLYSESASPNAPQLVFFGVSENEYPKLRIFYYKQ